MYQLRVELKKFSAAHRLVKGYQGKCNHLHGHNYTLHVVIVADQLGQDELVVDFSIIRACCDEWVQAMLDHSTLVCAEDTPLLTFLQREKQKHYVLSGNTTVECLARDMHDHLSPRIAAKGARLQAVELWESDDCGVIYSG